MSAQPRRTAAEIVAFSLGWDIADVREGRYQETRTGSVAVYVCGGDYFCAPRAGQNPPKGWDWIGTGVFYGRVVYCAFNSPEDKP